MAQPFDQGRTRKSFLGSRDVRFHLASDDGDDSLLPCLSPLARGHRRPGGKDRFVLPRSVETTFPRTTDVLLTPVGPCDTPTVPFERICRSRRLRQERERRRKVLKTLT